MTKCLAFQMPNGVIVLATAAKDPPTDMTEDQHLDAIAGMSQPVGSTRLPNQVMASLPDATQQYRHRWNGTAIVIDAGVPMNPDISGMKAWLKTNMTFAIRNNIMKAYPQFMSDLNAAEWADFQAGCLEANTAVPLTAAQWAAFKTACTTYYIPVTLP